MQWPIFAKNQNDYRARADTILKAKEVVLGKTPDTAIQINNNLSVDKKRKDMTDDELFAICKRRRRENY